MGTPASVHEYFAAVSRETVARERLHRASLQKQAKMSGARDGLHDYLVEAYVSAAELNAQQTMQERACAEHGGAAEALAQDDCAACELGEFIEGVTGIYKKRMSLAGAAAVLCALRDLECDGDVFNLINCEGLADAAYTKRGRWIVGAEEHSEGVE